MPSVSSADSADPTAIVSRSGRPAKGSTDGGACCTGAAATWIGAGAGAGAGIWTAAGAGDAGGGAVEAAVIAAGVRSSGRRST